MRRRFPNIILIQRLSHQVITPPSPRPQMISRKLFYLQTLYFSVFTGSLCGLCGNFNSVPRDDMTTKDGQVVLEPQVFGSSWRVGGKNACSRPLKPAFVQTSTQCSKKGPRIRERMCKPLRQRMFAACHKKLNPVNFFRLAHYDIMRSFCM